MRNKCELLVDDDIFFVIVDYVTWKKTFPFLLFHYLDFIMHNICMTLNFFFKLFQISHTQRILLWCRARARNMQLNLFIVRKEIATELDAMWSDSGRIWLKKLVCSIYLSVNFLLEPDLWHWYLTIIKYFDLFHYLIMILVSYQYNRLSLSLTFKVHINDLNLMK